MGTTIIHLNSSEDTEKFGNGLGQNADPGDVICLDGDLGAGKTTLSQAIARGLQVPDNYYVTSPSFSIFHEYPGRIPMYHMDFYRLHDLEEVVDLGFDEYFYQSGLTVIEWSKRAEPILPETALLVQLTISEGNRRNATITIPGIQWEKKIASILNQSKLQHTFI